MKKLLLICATIALVGGLSLRAYFAFVPPPESTLKDQLSKIIPNELSGWKIKDQDMAESPESSARISDFLNFDDALFRIFNKGDTIVGLYIAYWTPGKASYRWAGAHTPDTCWVLNGWTRLERKYTIPLSCNGYEFKPVEFGVYEKDGNTQNVYFWHLVGGSPFGYSQEGAHNIFGALLDIKKYGLNLRQEQFFIRLSSNKTIQQLESMPEFNKITAALNHLGLTIQKPTS